MESSSISSPISLSNAAGAENYVQCQAIMESSSISSPQSLSNTAGFKRKRDSGNQQVKDNLLSSSNCPTPSETSTMFHGEDWSCGPILFPFFNGASSESSDDSQSFSVPPPPPYAPECPDTGTSSAVEELEERSKIIQGDTDDKGFSGDSVVQQRGPNGQYYSKFNDFAREAVKWYNSKEGRKFELVDLVDVVLHSVCGILCSLTIEVVDVDAPMDPPTTFKAEYWWCRIGEEDGVISCHPIN